LKNKLWIKKENAHSATTIGINAIIAEHLVAETQNAKNINGEIYTQYLQVRNVEPVEKDNYERKKR
jgi:hypothetical protein